jgi:hypothetical protein
MDQEHMLDKLGKTEMMPTFSGMVREVTNVIEDPMSCAADPVKSTYPSMAYEAVRTVRTTCFSICNFSRMSSIKHVVASVGFHKTKENLEHMIGIDPGNMFAKKINLRDNFSSFNEFLNKYKDFAYIKVGVGIKLMPERG